MSPYTEQQRAYWMSAFAPAWCWLHPGITLLIRVPNRNGAFQAIVHTDRAPDDWSESGTVNAWDGDLVHPTLEGSLLRTDADPPWHVWLRRGQFMKAG